MTGFTLCSLLTVFHGLQAPIQLFGLEGRYAHALYSAATKQKKLDVVEKEVNSFKGLLEKDAKFSAFIQNPTVQRKTKSGQ